MSEHTCHFQTPPGPAAMPDRFGRIVDYLRISVTDRCNERCLYCMPPRYDARISRAEHLSTQEILRVVRVAASLGFRKFRLTGGEPLLRSDIVELVTAMCATAGVTCVGLSTNGTLLGALAGPLRNAGLRTVNISLDALDAALYHRITGGRLDDVLCGIQAAIAAGFECVKLNTVLLRGINECQVWPLVNFAAKHNLPLRFIELMPVSRLNGPTKRNFLSVTEVMARLSARGQLVPQPSRGIGDGPAKYYRLLPSGALVGFIGAITNRRFCDTCNRVRLTADGKICPCLGNYGELDLRSALRQGATDAALADMILQAVAQKPEAHLFRTNNTLDRPMVTVGG